VLWLKELGILFGNGIYATSTTLSVFAGGYVWGKQAVKISNLLRAYGLLEICIGCTAILYFFYLKPIIQSTPRFLILSVTILQ